MEHIETETPSSLAVTPRRYNADEIMREVITAGDLEHLSAQQLANYYLATCESFGFNPLSRPFGLIRLNGKLTFYALKNAAEQLRVLRGVSVTDLTTTVNDGLVTVRVAVQDRSGRTDQDIGVVPLPSQNGEARANALMKAVTKAKRRATLSLCGLGMLDESEIETIPNARRVEFDPLAAQPEIIEMEQPEPDGPSLTDRQRAMARLYRAADQAGIPHNRILEFAARQSNRQASSLRPLERWPVKSLEHLADLIEESGDGDLESEAELEGDEQEADGFREQRRFTSRTELTAPYGDLEDESDLWTR